jgi:uncharacterized protein (TIGR00369 family)
MVEPYSGPGRKRRILLASLVNGLNRLGQAHMPLGSLARTLTTMSESTKTITWSDPRASAAAAIQLSGLDFLKRMAAGEIPPPPIASLFGFELAEISEGKAVFEVVPDDSHYNPIGVVHGGLALTLLDSAAGCAVQSTLPAGLAYTSLETKVNFLRAITSDTGRLRAHGWVTKPGKRAAFAEADLRGSDGAVYATASSTCLVFPVG